ncbi:hypothetical protein RHMOL_RhmolUnG0004100 [Rhododendron molle]|nr:hypothetical protein RHMOL_RhmolUnG0004100 [Rhododendron molle]
MADGTISFADGLGSKALDSNEIRRKHRGIDPLTTKSSVVTPHLDFFPVNPNFKGLMSDSGSQPQSRPPLPDPTGVAMEDGEQAQGERLDSEERLSSLVRSLEAEMKSSGVIVDCSELKTQLNRLKEHHELSRYQSSGSDACGESSTSSLPQQPAAQEWTRVGNGKQQVGCDQSDTEQLNCPVTVHASIVPQQSNNPIVTPVSEEGITDSEEELIEVLEGVVSTRQRVEPIASQEVGSTCLHSETSLHDSKAEKETSVDSKISSHDQKLDGNGKDKPPDYTIPNVKLQQGGSSEAGHNGKQRSQSKGSHKKRK